MIDEQVQPVWSAINSAVVAMGANMKARHLPQKRDRVLHDQITMAQAVNAREAWMFAIRNETPLNVFASIHWGHAPSITAGLHPVGRNGKLRDGLKAWIYRNAPDVPFVWIEVREKTRAIGEHVHLVVHVPDHLRERFAKAVDRLVAHQSASVSPTAVDVRPVGQRWWDRYAYLMKAGTDEVRQRFMSPDQLVRSGWGRGQGTIEGARVRIAHAIGPTERKAAEILPDSKSAAA